MLRIIALTVVWVIHFLSSIPPDLAEKSLALRNLSDDGATGSIGTDMLVLVFQGVHAMFSTSPSVFMTIALLFLTFGVAIYRSEDNSDPYR